MRQTISNFTFAASGGTGNNMLPTGTALTISSGGTLDLLGGRQTIASLSDGTPGAGGSIVSSNTASTAVLTLSASGGSTVFSGTIDGTQGPISLVMSGSGTQEVAGSILGPGSLALSTPAALILSGTNSFTGGTLVAGGTLDSDGRLVACWTGRA